MVRWFAIAVLALHILAPWTPAAAGSFTDSAGRTVDLPAAISRVLPAGPPADALLYALAPDLMLGLTEPWSAAQKDAALDSARNLPAIPRLTGKPGEAELAALRDLRPGLIVDYGDVNEHYSALADKMQAATGAPYLLLSGKLEEAPGILRRLGAALGRAERGEALARAIEAALAKLQAVKNLPEAARIRVYYARGADGLHAVRAGSSLAEAIALAGGRTIVAAGPGALTTMTAEEVAKLAPQVVILADPEAAAPDAPLRQTLPPGTRFLIDPGAPYGWVERPPSINRILGALWLAAKLTPDKVAFSPAGAEALAAVLFHRAPDKAAVEAAFR